MKLKEMNKEQLNEYHRGKIREWRKKNKEKDLAQKKKWRDTHKEHRKIYQIEYEKNHKGEYKRKLLSPEEKRTYSRDYYLKYPEKFKQRKEYIRSYMKKYLEDNEKHIKYLLRQQSYYLKNKILKDKNFKCEFCNSQDNLEIHHKEYNNLLSNLMILCRRCHRKLHRKFK